MMEDDLSVPLVEISSLNGQSVVSQLIKIQQCESQTLRSFDWAQTLSCLSSASSASGHRDSKESDSTLYRVDVPIASHNYVAVSYRWDETCGSFFIDSGNGNECTRSRVRDAVIKRVLKYMDCVEMTCFWIDQECIDQEDPLAFEEAMQAMDLVYRCSDHPLGLIEANIEQQDQLDLLLALLSGCLTKGTRARLHEYVDYRKARTCLHLLGRLTADPWWKRRWIFQEEYCSDMNLLIPHVRGLSKRRWDKDSRSITEEVLVSVSKLREQSTLFCLACIRSGIFRSQAEWRQCQQILGIAKSYKILQRYPESLSEMPANRPMSVRIIRDLSYRKIRHKEDTLAILANCCGYSASLNTYQLARLPHSSLSLALLTLYLLNGEILWNKQRTSIHTNILNFLSNQAFDQFDPPISKGTLTFMKKCRFVNVHLLQEGIRTTGHLWHIRRYIHTNRFKLRIPPTATKDETTTICLRYLARTLKVRHPHLSRDILAYIDNSTFPHHISTTGLERVFDQTATYLATAIDNGQTLVVAQHTTNYSSHGIFACNWDANNTRTRPVFIFTATEGAIYSEEIRKYRSPDKFVSLTVYSDGFTDAGLRLLRVKGWVNGLAFPGLASEKDVVFQWPAVLRETIGEPSRSESSSDLKTVSESAEESI